MRILLLTQWFDPEPTFKGLAFARQLVLAGYEVEVVTGFPNYPGGSLYPGHKIKLLKREVIDGVNITRVPLYPSHNRSRLKRIANYVSFSASALFYCVFLAKRPDVIYAYHPPLTIGVVASIVRLVRGIPFVYDIQDMWPDTLKATGMLTNKITLGLVAKVCNFVYRRADKLTVLSPGFKTLLIERSVRPDKIEIIYNWANEESLLAAQKARPKLPGRQYFKILFAGNMGKAQSLETVINAAWSLKEIAPHVVFILIGGGIESSRLTRKISEMSLDNVLIFPPVSMSEIGGYIEQADVLLVHLRDDPLFHITIPSKTQAYMSFGKPILMGVRGDAAKLVDEANCGMLARPEDPQDLARVAAEFSTINESELAEMGRNARNFYQKNLSLAVGVQRFGEVFMGVINK